MELLKVHSAAADHPKDRPFIHTGSMLKALVRKLFDYLLVGGAELDSELSAEERQAVADYNHRLMMVIGRSVTNAGRIIFALSLPPLLYFPPPGIRAVLVTTHAAVLTQMLVWQPLNKRFGVPALYLFLLVEMTSCLGYAESIHQAFVAGPAGPDLISVLFNSILFMIAAIFTIILNPLTNGRVLLYALFLFTAGSFAWRDEPFGKLPDWMTLLGLTIGLALGVYYANTHRRRRELLNDLEARQLLLQKERSRLALVEKDLEEAGEMQDTFAPQSTLTTSNGFRLQCFQAKYGLLGGDWKAVRTLPDGTSVIIVADATGKGIKAALVIQAVQTLWAESERDPNFAPLAWIHALNRTLLSLGGARHHTMTLGMMLLNGDDLVYYSAGHLPVFLICRHDGETASLVSLLARGSLLGLSDDLKLEPARINQREAGVESILLGTDGVFDRGLRTRKQAVFALVDNLVAHGLKALEDCPAADDKLLVLVRRAA